MNPTEILGLACGWLAAAVTAIYLTSREPTDTEEHEQP